jgi:hypothetical protein
MNSLISKLSPSITDMIRMDHTHVLATFHRYDVDTSAATKRALVNTACMALEIHAQLEEEIFYPAMQTVQTDETVLNKSKPEHDEMRRLIAKLRAMEPTDAEYDETFMALMRDTLHHVADEETTLLPDAERRLADRLGELGAQMTKRRLQLVTPRAGELAKNTVRAFPVGSMMMAAGALLAGTYLMRRTQQRQY